MTITVRKYEEVSCPTCGALIGEHCVSQQSGRSLEHENDKRRVRRGHYAHIERMQRYKKQECRPINHTAWPVGRSPK